MEEYTPEQLKSIEASKQKYQKRREEAQKKKQENKKIKQERHLKRQLQNDMVKEGHEFQSSMDEHFSDYKIKFFNINYGDFVFTVAWYIQKTETNQNIKCAFSIKSPDDIYSGHTGHGLALYRLKYEDCPQAKKVYLPDSFRGKEQEMIFDKIKKCISSQSHILPQRLNNYTKKLQPKIKL